MPQKCIKFDASFATTLANYPIKMVEKRCILGTSNWVGDYFIATSGVGMVIRSEDPEKKSKVAEELNEIFLRDWNSNYTRSIQDYDNFGNVIHQKS